MDNPMQQTKQVDEEESTAPWSKEKNGREEMWKKLGKSWKVECKEAIHDENPK